MVDPVKAPGGIDLGFHRPHQAVLLDVLHPRVSGEGLRPGLAHLGGEPAEGVVVHVGHVTAVAAGHLVGDLRDLTSRSLCVAKRRVLENDDVTVGHSESGLGYPDLFLSRRGHGRHGEEGQGQQRVSHP